MSEFISNLQSRAPKGLLIYLLGVYVLVQFAWWAYMLVNLNADIYKLKLELLTTAGYVAPEQLILKAKLDQKLFVRIWMVLGEGAVFVSILLLGFWSVRKSISKELFVAEQQKNFLLSITHELKSPLAAIKLQLQTLQTRNLPEEKKTQLYSRALGDAGRLEKLVENLLLVNKVESGGLPLARKHTNLSELILNQIKIGYSKELEEERLLLNVQPDIKYFADELAIQSIIVNLIDNAIKYGAGSNIMVELRNDIEMIEFSVSDAGDGIPDIDKQKVFDRFYRRGNENVRQTKGTGIGLYLVKLLVVKHNGTISIEDNQPKGAKFRVRLPTLSQ